MLEHGPILIEVGKKIVIMQMEKLQYMRFTFFNYCLLSFIPPVSAVHK